MTDDYPVSRVWMVYSSQGGSTPGMFRPTDEADARAIYAAERDRIQHDSLLTSYGPGSVRQERIDALQLRSRIVTDWEDRTP